MRHDHDGMKPAGEIFVIIEKRGSGFCGGFRIDRIGYRSVIDIKPIVSHGYPVPWEPDNPFYQSFSIFRRIKNNDITPFWMTPFGQMPRSIGNFQIVGQFVDEDTIPLKNCWLHRSGRHDIPVRNGRFKRGGNQDGDDDGPDPSFYYNDYFSIHDESLKVKNVMIRAEEVHTIQPDKTVERAASIMTENEIGCLPVVEENNIVVGILTKADLLNAFQQMLGLPAEGVRATVRMPEDEKFAHLAAVVVENSWPVMGIGSFPSPRHPGYWDVVLKIPRVKLEDVEAALSNLPRMNLVDIREVV